ncbi:MAG: dienelactone hydrolase family protein [Alphaproteobacteria bacterium]|nr:dienelactone hydrolase family protein [Alphaproteobacteria bacterium]MBL6939343.1 dienelactone hydrolase family protein [Alphaproteobacteria bacterium]MBL7097176.1 dienelactone hydrolase family protein [Alphaproteobacteria bacterium]
MAVEAVTISLGEGRQVSGLWLRPEGARAALVLAHGAGVGMTHKSMAALAEGLAKRKIATLRFNFLYMEKKSGRPDAPPLAHRAVRAAVAEAGKRAGKMPLFAGGRSFGGRMTSQAQALEPLPKVRGLVFFAYPLHPAGKPGIERAEHLREVKVPMLFLQGSHDPLAELALLQKTVMGLKSLATLKLAEDADHSFHVPARTGRKDADVMDEILDTARDWMIEHA